MGKAKRLNANEWDRAMRSLLTCAANWIDEHGGELTEEERNVLVTYQIVPPHEGEPSKGEP